MHLGIQLRQGRELRVERPLMKMKAIEFGQEVLLSEPPKTDTPNE